MGESRILWEIPKFFGDRAFKEQILSLQFGAGRGIGGPETGKTSTADIVITRKSNENSTHIYREAINGKGRDMNFYFQKVDGSTPVTYLTLRLKNAMISSHQVSTGGDVPMETITFVHEQIEVSYSAYQRDSEGWTY